MQVSSPVEEYSGTIKDGSTYTGNSNKYYDVQDYGSAIENVVYDDYDIKTEWPSQVNVQLATDHKATVVVEQTEDGTAAAGNAYYESSGTIDAGTPGAMTMPVNARYVRPKVVNTAGGTATVKYSVRLVDF